MADQIERLIAAVEDVSRKLTRLSTYSHILYLGRGSTAVSATVSALMGILRYANIMLKGTLGSSSSVTGSMTSKYLPYGLDTVTASSNVTGNLDLNPSCVGSVSGASNASGAITLVDHIKGVVTSYSVVGRAHLDIT